MPAGADEDQDEVVVRATVSRLVLTIKEPVEIVESDVRNELERRRASAPIETVVPILTDALHVTDSGTVRRPDRCDQVSLNPHAFLRPLLEDRRISRATTRPFRAQ